MIRGSFKVIFNLQRVSYRGIASLYIRVKIGEQKKELPLGIRWAINKFDHENGLCRQRHPDDQEASDNNLIIRTEIARINEIFKYYRLSGNPFTINRFLQDYKYNFSKQNFTAYMEQRIRQRFKDREIIEPTYINHMKSVKKLKAGYSEVYFADFNETWAKGFDNYLRCSMRTKMEDNNNARWSIHKVVKTYIKIAKRDGILFVNPYDYFRIRPGTGSSQALFKKDLGKLYNYYHSSRIPVIHKLVLRCFLFSCWTGLRISDLSRVTAGWIRDGSLVFIPYKSRKKNKIVEVPLNKFSREMLNDSKKIHKPGEKLFADLSEQYANRVLKRIAEELKIDTRLYHHVGRHTFITQFYNSTKDLVTTQAFAGHENISSTMIYTHHDREGAKKKMKVMNNIL